MECEFSQRIITGKATSFVLINIAYRVSNMRLNYSELIYIICPVLVLKLP
jgi:hypothetical protein